MIRLIASDLDGTLIPEGSQTMEAGFEDVLAELLDKGYLFYAASGRQYANMYRRFGKYSDRMGFICENGALAMERGECQFIEEIPWEEARKIAEDILSFSETDILLSGMKACYIRPRTEWFEDQLVNVLRNDCVFFDTPDEIDDQIIKISMYIYDFPKNAGKMQDFFMGKYGDCADFVHGGNDWLDMIRRGSGKGKALRAVLDKKGIAADEIMVFGDNQNDISMLELTKNSYAMAHAKPDVRACAGHICGSVTAFLQDFLKKNS